MDYSDLTVESQITPLRRWVKRFLQLSAVAALLVSVSLWRPSALGLNIDKTAEHPLSMTSTDTRLEHILPHTLTPDQKALYDRIVAGARDSSGKPLKTRVNPDGSLTGPFNPMLLNPKLGQDGMNFLEDLRFSNLTISHRVVETTILRVAFLTKCGYEFCSHKSMAQHAGVTDRTIEAMRLGEQPPDLDADQTVSLALVSELNRGVGPGAVSDATYAVAIQQLGEQGVFEVVTVAGFYVALAQTINTFQMPCANGEPDPFAHVMYA
eukprot:TRINITY_DN33203_c0_g1_i1.p1 TRINITY_DN33203_c0_g1~~TRINITY_DN33203_c0_g1_i1.p1  ORF type:complete len:266 (-),score=15.33 TRINITY_DN33203_c0_g1_i1:13-810(-)